MGRIFRRSSSKAVRLRNVAAFALSVAMTPAAAFAQPSADDFAQLRQQLESLRAEQQRSNQKIAELEAALSRVPTTASTPASLPAQMVRSEKPAPSRLQLSGDLRLRYESNFGDKDARNRDRGVLRARLRAAYAINDWLTVGGQIATGDPDDPNSTDITLSNFADDLQVSLDQAYLRVARGNLQLYAGKMPQPFARTDLLWDSDVSPQGISANYKLPLGGGLSLKATGLYFLVDEAVAGPDSDMVGGQLAFETSSSAPLKLELAAAYYDYSLRNTAGSDAGDFRSNLFANGRYLSDFDLLDIIGAVTWSGLGEVWPVRLSADYVKNFGAITSDDSGYSVDLLVGRASKQGDWRFGYGYAQTGVDAVLAAFSHDNTNIATNYRQHSLSIDYAATDNVLLNATLYHYQPKNAAFAGTNDPKDWLDRLRLNFLINF